MTSVKKYTNESVLRSLLKSFSWRIIAISDTILTVFIVTCIMGDCGVKNRTDYWSPGVLNKICWLLYARENMALLSI